MCYLVAKDFDKPGSIAFSVAEGERLSPIVRKLEREKKKGIQIIAISEPDAYKEYAPYKFAKSKEEFESEVLAMG